MSKNNKFINDFNHENWKKTEELDHDKNLTQNCWDANIFN